MYRKKVANTYVAITILIIIFNVFLLFSIGGCSSSSNLETTTNNETSKNIPVIHIRTSVKLKHSSEDIINAAKSILEAETNQKPSKFSVIYVDYNEKEKSYIVDFCIAEHIAGGDVAVHLSEKDLSLIRVEFGE